MIVVHMDAGHRFLGESLVSVGLVNRSLVHPREIFAEAVERRASAIFCAHNHPAGDVRPTREDINVTKRLDEVGRLLDIPLLDHVIFGKGDYFSFADEGLV